MARWYRLASGRRAGPGPPALCFSPDDSNPRTETVGERRSCRGPRGFGQSRSRSRWQQSTRAAESAASSRAAATAAARVKENDAARARQRLPRERLEDRVSVEREVGTKELPNRVDRRPISSAIGDDHASTSTCPSRFFVCKRRASAWMLCISRLRRRSPHSPRRSMRPGPRAAVPRSQRQGDLGPYRKRRLDATCRLLQQRDMTGVPQWITGLIAPDPEIEPQHRADLGGLCDAQPRLHGRAAIRLISDADRSTASPSRLSLTPAAAGRSN